MLPQRRMLPLLTSNEVLLLLKKATKSRDSRPSL